jgi:hypothetical protein
VLLQLSYCATCNQILLASCLDLRYLLSIPPEEFDDSTRKGFLHGYSMLLDILTWMQGMDSHIR